MQGRTTLQKSALFVSASLGKGVNMNQVLWLLLFACIAFTGSAMLAAIANPLMWGAVIGFALCGGVISVIIDRRNDV